MKILYVDKIDGALVICESDNEEETRRYALPMEDAPAGVKVGDCIVIDNEGNATIDEERTKAFKEKARSRRKKR